MIGLNKIQLIGHVGKDPEIKMTSTGNKLVSLSFAVTERKEQPTVWFSLKFWEQKAEMIANYVKKGDPLFVTGAVSLDEWERGGEKRSQISVAVQDFRFLKKKSNSSAPKEEPDYPF